MKMPYRLPNVSCGGTLMRSVNLLVEDTVHEDFLVALVQRVANAYNIEIKIKVSSVRGGHETVITGIEAVSTGFAAQRRGSTGSHYRRYR